MIQKKSNCTFTITTVMYKIKSSQYKRYKMIGYV